MLNPLTSVRLDSFILGLGGLCGALGVVLAATVAHLQSEPGLQSASEMLLYHAGAGIGLGAWGAHDPKSRFWFYAAALVMLFGVLLFAGDLAIRSFYHFTFFHYAAPLGGLLVLSAWILVIGAAASRWRQSLKL